MSQIEAKSELVALWSLLKIILNEGVFVGNYLEISNLLLQIEYSQGEWERFRSFRDKYIEIAKSFAESGWSRATRVYTQTKDRPTKPSYRKRLVDFPDKPKRDISCTSVNQLDKISSLLASKPGYSNLSFIFFRPADLYDQFRPGYVPCPIAGDFKFRDGRLKLSVMFRTNDALSVGYADIFYLRLLQEEVLKQAKMRTESPKLLSGKIGDLAMFFTRTFIEKRKRVKSKDRSSITTISGIKVAEKLLTAIAALSR